MDPEQFVTQYESAIATQQWINIDPLVTSNVSVTFSDGTIHFGKDQVKIAFENNFSKIKGEKYAIKNIRWLKKADYFAVYLFEFYWTGIINQVEVSGQGIGTAVLTLEKNKWKLLTEHLGRTNN